MAVLAVAEAAQALRVIIHLRHREDAGGGQAADGGAGLRIYRARVFLVAAVVLEAGVVAPDDIIRFIGVVENRKRPRGRMGVMAGCCGAGRGRFGGAVVRRGRNRGC